MGHQMMSKRKKSSEQLKMIALFTNAIEHVTTGVVVCNAPHCQDTNYLSVGFGFLSMILEPVIHPYPISISYPLIL